MPPNYGGNRFASEEEAFQELAQSVLILSHEYGWSEDFILSLPRERLATYIEAHNKLADEAKKK